MVVSVTDTDPFRVTSLWLCLFCAIYRPLQGRQLMVVSVLCHLQTPSGSPAYGCISFVPGTDKDSSFKIKLNENSVSLLSGYLGSALQGLGFTQSKHFCDFGTYLLMGVR